MRTNKGISNGSALIAALVMAAIISLVAANALISVQQRYRATHQTMAWQEALLAAEAGVDLAMAEIRRVASDSTTNPWQGWTIEDDDNDLSNGFIKATIESSQLVRATEGANLSWSRIEVDVPLQKNGEEDWYRVRVVGVADVPGTQVLAGDKTHTNLRKLYLRRNAVLDQNITAPQAVRVIEVIAKPMSAFSKALVSNGSLDMNNHNIVVDSYDSLDSNKSTNGRYDEAKRGEKGDIATNGKVIDAGNAQIFGDASTNGGTVLNSENVSGDITNDFYQDLPYVFPPEWCNTADERNAPTDFNGLEVSGDPGIQASADETKRVLVSEIALNNKFTIKGVIDPDGPYLAEDGVTRYKASYVEIVVMGDIDITGNGEIELEPGVHVRIFGEKDILIGGNGFMNPGSALQLQLYGSMNPTEADDYLQNGTEPGDRVMKIAGNGGFCGSAYAPMHAIELKGGGNEDSIFGAFAGRTIFMNGVQSVHYDEQLANGGLISDYKIVSWMEDIYHRQEVP